MRRSLDGLKVAGLDEARAVASARPVLFAATHVAFWDAFVLLVLDAALGTEGYAVMDAENLCRVPFFTRLGAVPLQRGRPRSGLVAAAARLDRPGRALWVFPQGEPRPAHLRPLGFRPGVRLLARLAPAAAVVPVGLQYAFAAYPAPVAYAAFGPPLVAHEVAGRGGVARLEAAVERQLARIDACLAGEAGGFTALVPPRAERPRGPGERLLAALLAGRPPR